MPCTLAVDHLVNKMLGNKLPLTLETNITLTFDFTKYCLHNINGPLYLIRIHMLCLHSCSPVKRRYMHLNVVFQHFPRVLYSQIFLMKSFWRFNCKIMKSKGFNFAALKICIATYIAYSLKHVLLVRQ